jgi:hypothetical protein
MAMLRSELASHVLQNLGNRTNLTSSITGWLNFALLDIAGLRNWRSLQKLDTTSLVTTANLEYYGLPKSLKDIIGVQYIDGSSTTPLVYLPPAEFRNKFPHPATDGAGTPVWYTRETEYLRLYPLANEADHPLYLMGVFWPDEFSSTEDTYNPLDRLDYALIAQATSYGFGALDVPDKKQYWHNEALRLCRMMARKDGEVADETASWTPGGGSVQGSGFAAVPPVAVGSTSVTWTA